MSFDVKELPIGIEYSDFRSYYIGRQPHSCTGDQYEYLASHLKFQRSDGSNL